MPMLAEIASFSRLMQQLTGTEIHRMTLLPTVWLVRWMTVAF